MNKKKTNRKTITKTKDSILQKCLCGKRDYAVNNYCVL